MHIDLKAIRCFLALTQDLNFGRAAMALHMTQPALSAQIRGLEQQLGFTLFSRTTRRVSITPEGAEFLPHAQRVIEENVRLVEVAKALRRGGARPLRLGASFYTIDIPERRALMEKFFARHPDVPLEVIPSWQNSIVRRLRNGTIDVALLLGVPLPLSGYAAEVEHQQRVESVFPDDLPRLTLRRERIGLIAPRESSIAMFDPIPARSLEGLSIAMLDLLHGKTITESIVSALSSAGASVIIPPEPHSLGVERYGRQFKMPAVTLGWFGAGGLNDPTMVRRNVEGLHLETEFSVVASPISTNPALEIFWQEATAA